MKKHFVKFFLGFAVIAFSLSSCDQKKGEDTSNPNNNQPTPTEFLASTTASNRIAVLEDFTGVRCGYCPDGHVRAKAILDANPGKFIVLATHANLYANPATGWANFTTTAGTAIDAQAKPAGYPAGTMNRIACTVLGTAAMGSGSLITMGRGEWSKAATAVMAMPAPVNIGTKATYDAATKKLTVKVDMYFTADEPAGDFLNVAFVQDKLISKQSGGTPDPNAYEQNHVVRDMITPFVSTGAWGDALTEATTKGSKISRTYTYDVPNDYHGTTVEGGGAVVIANCSVVAYITRGKLEIVNAAQVAVK